MAGIEGHNNFFLKKLLPPELIQQMQAQNNNINAQGTQGTQGVDGTQGIQGVQGVEELTPSGQPKEDKQAEAKKQEVAPKIAEIEKKIKELEPKVQDKEKYEKYNQMKEKGIFPVYVSLEENFCGGCKVELPLNFVEKLKEKTMLPCEHCGRIIMLNK